MADRCSSRNEKDWPSMYLNGRLVESISKGSYSCIRDVQMMLRDEP